MTQSVANNPIGSFLVSCKEYAAGVLRGQLQYMRHAGSDVSSVSALAYAAGNQTAIAANDGAVERKLFNNSDQAIYIKEGATASSSSFTIKLYPNGFYLTRYSGRIDVIWDAVATGSLMVTENS